jgi:hypothetical protein
MADLTEQPQDTAGDTSSLSDLASKVEQPENKPDPALAAWIMEKVNRWRMSRDNNYGTMWENYYRIWRGKWDPSLKGKVAERSKLITPATQSAIDQTVSEMAEAVFGRGMWFDLSDPPPPAPQPPPQPGQPPQPPPPDWASIEETVRDNLIDDFADSRLVNDVVETFYNGAIFGTGIAKRTTDVRMDGTKYLCWKPVNPNGFVIDSSATNIDEALGVAHETIRPLHEVEEKQEDGEYFDEDVGSASGFGASDLLKGGLTDFLEIDPQDGVYITEYHGKVPGKLLRPKGQDVVDSDLSDEPVDESDDADDEKWVEAVVVIGNGTILLKAEENELKDRGFIAYQHHRSPNSFWGIGVAEKAFNAQAGLDGEVRARMDALALTTYPTVGVDATRMPRNLAMAVAPGKVYLTNGRPSEVIEPIIFGNLNNASFQQSGDMERYVQVATGATDPAKPVNGNTTASGQSQQSSAYIKRAKLTMQSVDCDFLSPLIRKSIIAYNALNPQRYPKIPQFTVNSTMSIMAREFEQAQMTNLLAIVPQQSPAFPIILKGIIENYSGPSKDKIIEAIEQSMKPDPAQVQAQQQTQQLTIAKLKGEVDKLTAEISEVNARAGLTQAKGSHEQVQTQLAPMQFQLQAKEADTKARNLEVQAAGMQIDHHHKTVDHLHKKVANAIALQKANQPAATAAAE